MRKVIYKSSRLGEEIGGKESQEAIAKHEGKPASKGGWEMRFDAILDHDKYCYQKNPYTATPLPCNCSRAPIETFIRKAVREAEEKAANNCQYFVLGQIEEAVKKLVYVQDWAAKAIKDYNESH